jgi:hypothetical protein
MIGFPLLTEHNLPSVGDANSLCGELTMQVKECPGRRARRSNAL